MSVRSQNVARPPFRANGTRNITYDFWIATTILTWIMEPMLNRRDFLKGTTLAAAGTWLTGCQTSTPRPRSANEKLNCVQIGCGGRGLTSHVDWLVTESKDNLVAIVDPDEKRQA